VLHVQHVVGEGRWLVDQVLLPRLEGMVATRLDSVYRLGEPSREWLKIKRKGRCPRSRSSAEGTRAGVFARSAAVARPGTERGPLVEHAVAVVCLGRDASKLDIRLGEKLVQFARLGRFPGPPAAASSRALARS